MRQAPDDRRSPQAQKGAALVEFAIAILLLLVLIFGIIGYFMFAAFEVIAKRRGALEIV